ncbi:MAG: hypothetical protein IJI09_08265 [Clostridia bacterium]|nr:hypothetical protein [Clostridia bacterium]
MKKIRWICLALLTAFCLTAASESLAVRVELEDGRYYIISVGGSFAYSRDTEGHFRVWGDNQYGQLGKGHGKNNPGILGAYPADFSTANQDIDLNGIRDIVSGSDFSFFLMEDGSLYGVGNSSFGTLGKKGGRYYTHTAFPMPEPVAALSCGFGQVLALTENGQVYAWGRNHKGQVGNGTKNAQSTPVKLPLKDIVQVAAGGHFSLALDSSGQLWGWGDNEYKTISSGREACFTEPTPIDTGALRFTQVSAGGFNVTALDRDGAVWTWGRNHVDQLGYDTKGKTVDKPTRVSLPLPAVSVNAYSSQCYAMLSDSSLWSWGNNGYGQLGQGIRGVAGAVAGQCWEKDVILVESGSMFVLAMLRDGTMLCAGFNNHAELGTGSTDHRNKMSPNGMTLIK